MLKGALVAADPDNPPPRTISFQYNPGTVQRSLTPQIVGGETGDRSEVVRFTGAALQTISLTIELDAADQLADGDPVATKLGIAPQLAALELLAYPTLQQVQGRQQQLETGTIEVIPRVMEVPPLYFIWGPKRVLPVRINSYQITEELFDPNLNPIQASVALSMRVLTYSDVASDDPQYSDFVAYQQSLVSMAAQAQSSATQTGVDVSRL